jgi:hypothetical protein
MVGNFGGSNNVWGNRFSHRSRSRRGKSIEACPFQEYEIIEWNGNLRLEFLHTIFTELDYTPAKNRCRYVSHTVVGSFVAI